MGCFHAKCCSLYPTSSDEDMVERNLSGNKDIRPNENYQQILADKSLGSVFIPSHNLRLAYSSLTQRGYYPESLDKENQDCFCIITQLQGNPNLHLFGVFDGHGQFGAECSNFVKDKLVDILSNDPTLSENPLNAYNSAFQTVNSELHESEIDDSMSGTTAIVVLVNGDTLFVANVGDSRAVIAVKSGDGVLAENLSWDQTPFRKDECERVKQCGARVLTIDQVEGVQDHNIQTWSDNESECGDPPRLWVQDGLYPGTAFTRSVGDSTAEKIGVISVPEVSMVQLTPSHLFFVVASDGVFEFLSSQVVVDMVKRYPDSREACAAIAGESYKIWLEHENRTDDITIIIVHTKYMLNSGIGDTHLTGANIKPASARTGNGCGQTSLSVLEKACQSLRRNFSKLLCLPVNLPNDHTPASVVPTHVRS
ncbi:phosphatase 2C and cyclic nucleotide-binding/kinase domain-containing protein [Thalictrum thalictroides]|uniref:protein-serine/threonine phosphatase n=1 Tax=Thalictrum thalictroides TaxID=46969 RepID=A0A7J6X871_THATH|nr:phosphatase 2C and cyclic nucleotide-binding/kinase domain-containing protein [Thalictrum thalictroides]